MGIRRKIVIMQFFLAALFIFVLYIMGQQVWGKSYLLLERDEVKNSTVRAYMAWEGELDNLSSKLGDWALWDDTYFLAKRMVDWEEFVAKNLSDPAMVNLKINIALIADQGGNVLFGKAIDLVSKKETVLPPELLPHIQHVSKLLPMANSREDSKAIKGFVALPEYPALIVAQRLLTSNAEGPSSGLLIFVRYADDAFISELSGRLQEDVSFAIIKGQKVDSNQQWQEIVNDDIIKGYYMIRDLCEDEGYYLVTTVPRRIYKQGQEQMKAFMNFTVIFGIIFAGATLWGLNEILLLRLRKMEAFMNSLMIDKDFSSRLDISGKDELAKVAATMNGLCESVQNELEERKKAEETLTYLSLYDSLTGVYNRTFFEQELSRVAQEKVCGVGIICCDVDGLKFINDTLGHHFGDEMLIQAAQVLKSIFADEDSVIARIGGDEFAILLKNTDEKRIMHASQRIKESLENSRYEISGMRLRLSVGCQFSVDNEVNEESLRNLLKEADNLMYRQKLASRQSKVNSVVQVMMKMLEERDFITEGHSQRLQNLITRLGIIAGLSEDRLTDLRLLAQFHDIGKVGISDRILMKPGKLTYEEKKEMERHSEIGHRISQMIPELMPISDYILKHHEWWDGHGYPIGLRGEEIPIESRILAIADAFDAMTNDRPYRQAMSKEEAVAELQRCSGVQFDPNLVWQFIGMIMEEEKEAIPKVSILTTTDGYF